MDKEFIDNPVIAYEKLQQENAELKAYKDVNEDFKKAWEELKAENEEIRKINDANAKLMIKLRDCLDEIEEIANTLECDCAIRDILQLIKQAKEGGNR